MKIIEANDNNIYDKYIWLKLNKNLCKKYSKDIDEIILQLEKDNNIRLLTLYENLRVSKKNKKVKVVKIKKCKDLVKCENIIKEFILLEDIEELRYFLQENKSNKNIKSLLEDAILNEIFINEDNDFNKLFKLLKKNSIISLKNIKIKLKKMKNDNIYLDFNNRYKLINNL